MPLLITIIVVTALVYWLPAAWWPAWVLVGGLGVALHLRASASLWMRRVSAVLSPLVVLGLMRALALGAWPTWMGFIVLLCGVGSGQWALTNERWSADVRMRGVWWSAAVACVGINSPLGLVAALWILLAHAVCDESWVASPFALALGGIAWWSAVAAAVASRSWLLAGVFMWWAVSSAQWAGDKGQDQGMKDERGTYVENGFALGVVLFAGWLTQRVLTPLMERSGLGLNGLGTPEALPWLGLLARDAANQRVLALPLVVWAAVAAVIAALVTLGRRWVQRRLGRP